MKKIFYSILVGCLLLFPYSVGAYTINDFGQGSDRYIGYNSVNGSDIIGDSSLFSVLGMNVSFGSGILTVDVYSRYFDNIGALGTRLGDLFISTNGWHPYGDAPYLLDGKDGSGELWEFATHLDGYDEPSTTSGNLSLYSVSIANIIYSDYYFKDSGLSFRSGSGQEVRYDPKAAAAVATGTWAIIDTGNEDIDILRFIINSNFDGVSDFGFRWTMTCANDVVEGSYTRVPEPGSLLLLGLGLLGVGILRKRL